MICEELDRLSERLEVADQIRAWRGCEHEPHDLPGRYGRAIQAINHLLHTMNCESVVAGDWAVAHHGFVGRISDDIDIVLPANRIDEFMRRAAAVGFQRMPEKFGSWPKLWHTRTETRVDIVPQGASPGAAVRPALSRILHPSAMGASGAILRFIRLPSLVELKIAAARVRDEADVVELIRANADEIPTIRQHLAEVHADYVAVFDRLAGRAQEQQEPRAVVSQRMETIA